MKKTVLFTLFIGILLSFQVKGQNTVSVKVTNIQSDKGTVYIAFFDSSKDFPNHNHNERLPLKKLKPVKGSIEFTFSDIKNGTYAIAVYHDINNNNKLDKNFFGIPKEPYAFSKNVNHAFSAPTFDECKLNLENSNFDLTIKLNQ